MRTSHPITTKPARYTRPIVSDLINILGLLYDIIIISSSSSSSSSSCCISIIIIIVVIIVVVIIIPLPNEVGGGYTGFLLLLLLSPSSPLLLSLLLKFWGGWGCEVSCGGHHRQRGKTTTGSALGAVLDFTQILACLVHNMSRSQLYLGFGDFGWLPFFRSITFCRVYG